MRADSARVGMRAGKAEAAGAHRQHLGAEQALGIFQRHAARGGARQLGKPLLQVQDVFHRGIRPARLQGAKSDARRARSTARGRGGAAAGDRQLAAAV